MDHQHCNGSESNMQNSETAAAAESRILTKQEAKDDHSLQVKPQRPFPGQQVLSYESAAVVPQYQIMSGDHYDPNRIPPSVFMSKSPTPMDWSLASNESLFSIHMGNNSFSRDHMFFAYKSGEIPYLDESNHIPLNSTPSIDAKISQILIEDTVKGVGNEENTNDDAKQQAEFATKKAELMDETEKIVSQDKKPSTEEVRDSSSSAHSFQFPLLTNEEGRSSQVSQQESEQPTQQEMTEKHKQKQSLQEENSKQPSTNEQKPADQQAPKTEIEDQLTEELQKSLQREKECTKLSEQNAETPAAVATKGWFSWLSWFSCCSVGGYCK